MKFPRILLSMGTFLCCALAQPFLAGATAPFQYDAALAIDLARAYLRSSLRAHPDAVLARVAFDQPAVVAVIGQTGRQLVSVTFVSPTGRAGAYVVLERCEETGLLLAVEVGTVDNIVSYRRDLTTVNAQTYIALPRVCPSTEAP